MLYRIFFSYMDCRCRLQDGIYHTDSLTDVFAFCDMVKRHGGRARCNLSERV